MRAITSTAVTSRKLEEEKIEPDPWGGPASRSPRRARRTWRAPATRISAPTTIPPIRTMTAAPPVSPEAPHTVQAIPNPPAIIAPGRDPGSDTTAGSRTGRDPNRNPPQAPDRLPRRLGQEIGPVDTVAGGPNQV